MEPCGASRGSAGVQRVGQLRCRLSVSLRPVSGSRRSLIAWKPTLCDPHHPTPCSAQGAVVMSLDTYNSLMETVHLLRSPANAAHLQRSLDEAERGELSG